MKGGVERSREEEQKTERRRGRVGDHEEWGGASSRRFGRERQSEKASDREREAGNSRSGTGRERKLFQKFQEVNGEPQQPMPSCGG